jgi:thioredoxin-dependent peroxiredoxin
MSEVIPDKIDINLQDQNGELVSLSAYLGKWVVLWWYPEAGSEGCSVQAQSLKKNHASITELGAEPIGISFNTTEQNDVFSCDYDLGMPLLSDADMAVGRALGVVREPGERFADKPRRMTFFISPDGKVVDSELVPPEALGAYGERVIEQLVELQKTTAGN